MQAVCKCLSASSQYVRLGKYQNGLTLSVHDGIEIAPLALHTSQVCKTAKEQATVAPSVRQNCLTKRSRVQQTGPCMCRVYTQCAPMQKHWTLMSLLNQAALSMLALPGIQVSKSFCRWAHKVYEHHTCKPLSIEQFTFPVFKNHQGSQQTKTRGMLTFDNAGWT